MVDVMYARRPPKQKPIVKIARSRPPSIIRSRSAATATSQERLENRVSATWVMKSKSAVRSRTPIPAVRPK